MDDLLDTDDAFKSSSELLRKLDPDELRIMAEQLRELQASAGWQHLVRLMRLEREVGVRLMCAGKVLEHAKYAHTAGKVAGLAAPWALLAKVETTHRAVQATLARDNARDGES